MRTMKKALCILTAAAMTALLYGCAQETKSVTEVAAAVSLVETAPPEVTETAETVAPTEETVPAEEKSGQTEPRKTDAPTEETAAAEEEIPAQEELPEQTEPAEEPETEKTPEKPAQTHQAPVTAHVHSWQHRVTEPTCTQKGFTTHVCGCGATYTDGETAAAGHAWGQWTVENASGCTRRSCSVCGEQETDRTAHVHQFTVHYTKEPCCKEEGYTQYLCTGCKATYTGDYTEKLPHNYTATVVAPTETSRGYTEHTCTVCGNSYRDSWTDPTAPEKPEEEVHVHSYTVTVAEPTCKEDGYTTHRCDCGDSYRDNRTAATGHSWSKWEVVLEPTEDAEGSRERVCVGCEERETAQIAKLSHTHSYNATVTDPTCAKKGYTTHRCACGDYYRDTWTDAVGHNWSPWVVEKEATESTAGYRKKTCSLCGIGIGEEIPVLPHSHSYIPTVTGATCTREGYTTYTCADCGDSYTADRTAAAGHSYSHETVKPTCTMDGYKVHSCRKCNDSYTDSQVAALGHSWGSWVTVTEPTEYETGSAWRSCARCGDAETKILEKLPHSHNFAVTVDYREATCQSEGYCTRACACGETCTEILTAEHNWVQCSEPEVGHYDVRIVCHCGWSCSAEGNYIVAFADHVAGIDKETRYDHSYYDTAQWVVDVPARYWVACGTCGAQQ